MTDEQTTGAGEETATPTATDQTQETSENTTTIDESAATEAATTDAATEAATTDAPAEVIDLTVPLHASNVFSRVIDNIDAVRRAATRLRHGREIAAELKDAAKAFNEFVQANDIPALVAHIVKLAKGVTSGTPGSILPLDVDSSDGQWTEEKLAEWAKSVEFVGEQLTAIAGSKSLETMANHQISGRLGPCSSSDNETVTNECAALGISPVLLFDFVSGIVRIIGARNRE